MAITNFETRELHCKIVYFGASDVGKTENLRSIYRRTSPEVRAGLFDLGESGPSKYFEFLPLSLGYVRDYQIKLHLYTYFETNFMRTLPGTLLKGLDGFVFVNDARVDALASNIKAYDETKRLLADEGFNVSELPQVIQYNKMDLDHLVPLKILKEELNPFGGVDCSSVATASEGTMETLRLISQMVLRQIVTKSDLEKIRGGVWDA